MGLLDGKIALVAGVANKRSLAWAIARRLAEQGATLAFTYQGERIESSVRELAASVGSDVVIECDVADDASIDKAFAQLVESVGGLDLMVHSIAFAQAHDLAGRFTDTKRDDYRLAVDISAYSLVAMTQRAEPLMEARGGGAIVTMTYLGGERAIPGYNVMGVAKAALDASMRYLAADLGPKNIRVNAISAGPVRTLAARGIAGFSQMEGVIAERAPMKRGIDADDVGQAGPLPALADGRERDRHDPLRRRRLPRDGPVERDPSARAARARLCDGGRQPGRAVLGVSRDGRRLAHPARLRARCRLVIAGARCGSARRRGALAPALRSRRRPDSARASPIRSVWRATGRRHRCTSRRAAPHGSRRCARQVVPVRITSRCAD